MNKDRLLRIANRINLLLLRELGQGIDVKRLIAQPRYARDVLLVCDARPGSDLASLAQHFRVARTEPLDAHGHASTFGFESTGFGRTRPPAVDSGFDLPPLKPQRSWYSPSRWLGL
jgi:hypothetical protein